MEKIAENTWKLSRCADAIHWLFVVTPGDWMVQKVVPDVHKCIGVVFVGDGEPDSLIRAALLRTHPIATPYLRRLHDLLAPEDVEPVSKRRFNLLAEVCGLAFPESSDIADNVLAEYKNVTLNTKTKTMEIDDETADAVEILAGQEGINASDIQEVRDTIKKSVLRQIKAQRSVQLKKKAAAKAARKKKKEEKKKRGRQGPVAERNSSGARNAQGQLHHLQPTVPLHQIWGRPRRDRHRHQHLLHRRRCLPWRLPIYSRRPMSLLQRAAVLDNQHYPKATLRRMRPSLQNHGLGQEARGRQNRPARECIPHHKF